MSKMEKQSKLALIFSMCIFGTIGIFRRYIPLPSGFLAMSRGFIGMLFLVGFVIIKGDKISWSAIGKNLKAILLSGAMIGFNWILLFESYQYTSVATATLCYYMAPVFVILMSPILLKEKLTWKKLICIFVTLIGMVFVSGVLESGFSGIGELKGILLGLGAAVLYASVIILNKKIKDISAYDKTIMQLGTAAVVLIPYAFWVEDISGITFSGISIVMLLVVGIIHTGIAYAMYFGSMKDLKAQTVALFSYIDPIVAIILSAVILHEGMSLVELIGAILVLGATMVSELPEKTGK